MKSVDYIFRTQLNDVVNILNSFYSVMVRRAESSLESDLELEPKTENFRSRAAYQSLGNFVPRSLIDWL